MCQWVLRLRYECQGLRTVYQVNEVGRMNKGEGKRKRKVIDICGLLLCSIMINDIVSTLEYMQMRILIMVGWLLSMVVMLSYFFCIAYILPEYILLFFPSILKSYSTFMPTNMAKYWNLSWRTAT